MPFERLDASVFADARPQRQGRRPKRARIDRHDPGERVLEHKPQDLLVAFRLKDVLVFRHCASLPRPSFEFRRP